MDKVFFVIVWLLAFKQAWKSFSNYDLAISIFKPIYPSLSKSLWIDSNRFELIWVNLSLSESIQADLSRFESNLVDYDEFMTCSQQCHNNHRQKATVKISQNKIYEVKKPCVCKIIFFFLLKSTIIFAMYIELIHCKW